MSHVPKRVTQHGLFTAGAETLPPALKPGQQELHRRGLYSAELCGAGESYLAQELCCRSEYAAGLLAPRAPEHFRGPAPAQAPEPPGARSTGTGHWRSEYRARLSRGPAQRGARAGPHASLYPPSCIGRADDATAYHHDFGRYGSDPRDRILPGEPRLPVLCSVLDAGTTRGSEHVPGYQGHIPERSGSPGARVWAGRSVDKTNITQAFHTNLVGYAGHVPESFRNDSGGRKPTSLTVSGRDFQTPRAAAA